MMNFKEYGVSLWPGLIWFRMGHGNEHLGFIRGVKFLAQLSDYQVLNKNSAGVAESLE
jgi:hypothetical protein